eukprot:TRINITY_DN3250_c0_g1_i1.p1 TRINITY_DN3250_c0_g1~~TRINITY_DN3250_c0_g1_i1.p1  ORF type:complete len:165 (-),score=53.04 TRINITY_DN3250_c0_g1_i1:133-627(-)
MSSSSIDLPRKIIFSLIDENNHEVKIQINEDRQFGEIFKSNELRDAFLSSYRHRRVSGSLLDAVRSDTAAAVDGGGGGENSLMQKFSSSLAPAHLASPQVRSIQDLGGATGDAKIDTGGETEEELEWSEKSFVLSYDGFDIDMIQTPKDISLQSGDRVFVYKKP